MKLEISACYVVGYGFVNYVRLVDVNKQSYRRVKFEDHKIIQKWINISDEDYWNAYKQCNNCCEKKVFLIQ